MLKKKDYLNVILIGLALFSMFVGAGNIIFPFYIGAVDGQSLLTGLLGFCITGIGLPVLGVMALSKAGGTSDSLSQKISPLFAKVLNVTIILIIGPLFAIPRTAATTVELAILPYFQNSYDTRTLLIVGSLIFFIICLYFILSPKTVVDRLGTILSPLLIIFLLTLIFISLFRSVGNTTPTELSNPFSHGFIAGYQTMDTLAAIIFGSTIYQAIKAKGYDQKHTNKLMPLIAAFAGICIAVLYAGLCHIGAQGSDVLRPIEEKTALTVMAVQTLSGGFGQLILSFIIFFACMTTAIGLIVTASNYFYNLFGKRISYRNWAIIITVISYFISIIGVEGILLIAAPVLELIYPIAIVLILLNLLGKTWQVRKIYIFTLVVVTPFAIINALAAIAPTKDLAVTILDYLPLGSEGLVYLLPALIAAVIARLIFKSTGNEKLESM